MTRPALSLLLFLATPFLLSLTLVCLVRVTCWAAGASLSENGRDFVAFASVLIGGMIGVAVGLQLSDEIERR